MKNFFFLLTTIAVLFSSCTKSSTSDLVAKKLNEITGNPAIIKTTDKGFYASLYDEDILTEKENYSVIYELQDYLYNDLHLYSTADTMKIIDPYNIIIDYIADDAIITTSVIYEDIGPDNHPIWRYRCLVEVKQK